MVLTKARLLKHDFPVHGRACFYRVSLKHRAIYGADFRISIAKLFCACCYRVSLNYRAMCCRIGTPAGIYVLMKLQKEGHRLLGGSATPTEKLGGNFGPEKLFTPPPNSPQTPSSPLSPPLSQETPPPGIPPRPGASDSPFPFPPAEKIKYPKRPP